MKTAVIVTTFNRPAALARSLPQIVAAAREVGAPVLVVDDGSTDVGWTRRDEVRIHTPWSEYSDDDISAACVHNHPATLLRLPENRGLAGALNIGLSYWLADPSIQAISYFQDDVEVDPLCIAACNELMESVEGASTKYGTNHAVVTGHDAKEHRERGDEPRSPLRGIDFRGRFSCRATHMMLMRDSWAKLMPIPSRALGLPSKTIRDANRPNERGTGSGVDWWIVRDSPNHLPVLCIPGLVRTFAWRKEESTWDNQSIAGEDGPLHREAIKGWIDAR